MSIKSDRWIHRMTESQRMIEPFEPNQIKQANGRRLVSYGTSSYGYDIRCSSEFKIFTSINSTIVDLESAPDDVCETSCKDRGGKYQGQVGVTLPKI